MHPEKLHGHVAEHGSDLGGGHGGVRADGRQHVGELFPVILPGQPGQLPGPRMEAGDVGRQAQDLSALAQPVQRGEESGSEVVRGELGRRRSCGKENAHLIPFYVICFYGQ